MGFADRLKDLKTKAVDATVERSDKIHEAVEKVATTADARTGGKYHDKIQQAGAKAGSLVDGLAASDQAEAAASAGAAGSAPAEPAASAEPAPPAAPADDVPADAAAPPPADA
jgi:MT0933-like antitoxin protein